MFRGTSRVSDWYTYITNNRTLIHRMIVHAFLKVAKKTTQINCPVIGGATHLTFQQHLSALKAATMTNNKYAAVGSSSSLMIQKFR